MSTNFLTTQEARSRLACNKAALLYLISTGQLQAFKLGRRWRVETESVEKFLRTREDTLTPKEAAELLKVSRHTVLRWIRKDKLRAWRMRTHDARGNRWRISRKALAVFLARARAEQEE